MDIKDYKFDVGDEVITVDGRHGKIVDICDCEMCRSRGFLEPFWQPFDGGTEVCISVDIASADFDGYYRIGKYRFNDFDKSSVLQHISDRESELCKLNAQLTFIEQQEHATDPEKALIIVESISKDFCGNWIIPHYYKPSDRTITLNNGEEVKEFMTDEVYYFLDYIKELIRKEINKNE